MQTVVEENLKPFVSAQCRLQPWQVVYTRVPLLPSSIIWYQPMGGNARLLER